MKKALLTGLVFFLLPSNSLEINNFVRESDKISKVEKKEVLWTPSFFTNYLSKFNLSGNPNFEKNKKITLKLPPRTLINLDSKLLNLESTVLESITYPNEEPTEFKKFGYLFNDSDKESITTINYDSNSVLNIKTDFSKVRNGPFIAFPENGKIKVRSFYGAFNVFPMKFTLEDGKNKDEINFIDEKNYSPYYSSKRLSEKDSLTTEDIQEILDSYENLYGDYFKVNYKALVCTDAATSIIKTLGINLEKELDKNKIWGNSYRQKNVSVIKNYLKKKDSNSGHLFQKGKLEKILKFGSYEDLTPENFGMENFIPGQIILLTRFYNSGPRKGKIQREDVHFGVIYGVEGNKIKEASMVTSHMKKPPYDGEIQLSTIDFEEWYKRRSNYTGSDETKESLTYRVYGIIDLPLVINQLKKENQKNSVNIK